jgi:hypothetical protein
MSSSNEAVCDCAASNISVTSSLLGLGADELLQAKPLAKLLAGVVDSRWAHQWNVRMRYCELHRHSVIHCHHCASSLVIS